MGFLSQLFKKEETVVPEGDPPPETLPSRNDLCWCGSGQKYKKCHLDQDQRYLEQKRKLESAAKKDCSPVFG